MTFANQQVWRSTGSDPVLVGFLFVCAAAMLSCGDGRTPIAPQTDAGPGAAFADSSLEGAVRAALGKPRGGIDEAELSSLSRLDAVDGSIIDLGGIEQLSNLEELRLAHNQIADIALLGGISRLRILDLSHNRITDLSPLSGLPELTHLNMDFNRVKDLSPLSALRKLEVVNLTGNLLTDVSALAELPALESAELSGNPIGKDLVLQQLESLLKKGVRITFETPLKSVSFRDPALEAIIRNELDKDLGVVTREDLRSIRSLRIPEGAKVTDLSGLEPCTH